MSQDSKGVFFLLHGPRRIPMTLSFQPDGLKRAVTQKDSKGVSFLFNTDSKGDLSLKQIQKDCPVASLLLRNNYSAVMAVEEAACAQEPLKTLKLQGLPLLGDVH